MKNQRLTVIITAAITTIVIIVCLVLLMPFLGPRFMHPLMMGNASVPVSLDTSSSRLSDGGLYRVSWDSDSGSVPLSQIHSWTLRVETPNGEPVEDAVVRVDGGMPQHGHGLPTSPQVTEYLGDGEYRVEGMKFQMRGWWEVRFLISEPGQSDAITFNLTL
jgi:hypothetical protein